MSSLVQKFKKVAAVSLGFAGLTTCAYLGCKKAMEDSKLRIDLYADGEKVPMKPHDSTEEEE